MTRQFASPAEFLGITACASRGRAISAWPSRVFLFNLPSGA
jgi:hypothetical protein